MLKAFIRFVVGIMDGRKDVGFCWRWWTLILLCTYSSASTSPRPSGYEYRKVCRGATSTVSHSHGGSPNERYAMYVKQYSNCTHINGNLVIVFLEQQDDYDMSFLQEIQEVSGYVFIMGNFFSYLNLTSLRIIRGQTLWEVNSTQSGCSLYVAKNYKQGSTTVGLKQLGLTSLHEIMAGNVCFYNNNMLCYESTINWMDILIGENAEVNFLDKSLTNFTRTCNQCHPKCTDGHCWGDGPDMCQKLTKVICSKQCDSRCFGLAPNECCHPECAGGCFGPLKTDCFACKNVINEDECVAHCPPLQNYDKLKFQLVPNPKAKYLYGTMCVKECPGHLIEDNGACVSECSPGHMAVNQKCVPCNGPCPKSCPGTERFLDMDNINNFTGCTVINGNVNILYNTFTGDIYRNLSGISVNQLSVFENVQQITGSLVIQARHEQFVNLSFFRNLVTIFGRNLDSKVPGASPLQIFGTSLEFLGLISLKEILNGKPLISSNPNLCYVSSVNWSSIIKSSSQVRNTKNKNETICEMEGKVCSPLCSSDGCWGPGDDQCLRCDGYKLGKLCVASCDLFDGLFTVEENGTKECRKCHSECQMSCSGEGSDQCHSCKHFKDGPYCVASCPLVKYPNGNGECQYCHENCFGSCTGPENTVGPGACIACSVVVYDGYPLQPVKCLPPESDCEVGFFRQYILSANSKTERHQACYRCHPECTECTGPDITFCSLKSCVNYVQGSRCISNCSSDHYPDSTRQCHQCDSHCLRCTGNTSSNCIACRELKVFKDIENRDVDPSFACVDKCPDSQPSRITDEYKGEKDSVCVTEAYADKKYLGEDKKKPIGLIIGVVVGIICLIILFIIFAGIYMRKQEEKKLRLMEKLNGLAECEPLDPTNAKPDMALLRLIKESELHRENIIGSGAFGTVYKGAWIPDGENVKIPVAIKVLQEGTPSQNRELLEEARIMASVVHPCCVRILAICATAQMMLVTQLMPLGCLLDYIRKYQANIGSKALLNWSTQIARGMKYLEDCGIVHRDLAARNILVYNPNLVKITDFGLSKLLDYNQEHFLATGGKMPIKWLALECIQHRIFTHKSDVWSYGVTIWEMCTYGQRPYDSVPAREMPFLLEKGERLPQPAICTIDVYMIMIKCWMLDADSRPSFHELTEEFAKMARDPGRYLVIQGDKLMKLLDQKYETKDLLTGTDGPEQIISADEYLQPQQLLQNVQNTNKAQSNGPADKRKKTLSHNSSNSPASSGSTHETRYGVLGAGHKRREHKNSRYSSDPCKLIGASSVEQEMEKRPQSFDDFDGKEKRPSELDVPIKLSVDEDDYLQPSLSSPSTYLEVIESDPESGTRYSERDAAPVQQPGPVFPEIINNPEYFEEHRSPKNQANNSSRQSEKQPLKIRNPSLGSEPEYYNEQDKLYVRKPNCSDPRPYNESEV